MVAANPITSPGVYQIRCLVNGKVYIGSAVDINNRWCIHRRSLERNRHHSVTLQRAWIKHGADAFVFEMLEVVPDRSDLIRVEQEYLDRIRPFDKSIGYNISPTAGSSLGIKRTPEYRARMSAALKGHKPSAETRIKLKARAYTDERRAKISASLVGNLRCKGRKQSPEIRAKISANQKPLTAEMRAKMSVAAKARWHRCRTFKQQTFRFE